MDAIVLLPHGHAMRKLSRGRSGRSESIRSPSIQAWPNLDLRAAILPIFAEGSTSCSFSAIKENWQMIAGNSPPLASLRRSSSSTPRKSPPICRDSGSSRRFPSYSRQAQDETLQRRAKDAVDMIEPQQKPPFEFRTRLAQPTSAA